jgi:YD repeat-containing protein
MNERLASRFISIPVCLTPVWLTTVMSSAGCDVRDQESGQSGADPRISEIVSAASVGGSSPARPCALRLGTKPWEGGSQCTGNLSIVVQAGPVNLIYNSIDARQLGPAGNGWRLGVRERLQVGANGSVTRIRPDGEPVVYAVSGSAWTSPPESKDDLLTHPTAAAYVIREKGGLTRTFTRPNGAAWLLSTIRDRVGNTTTVNVNSQDQETSIVDSVGNTTTLTWSAGLLASVTDAEGLRWSTVYQGTELVGVRSPAVGGATPTRTFSYDTSGHHLLLRDTSPSGVVTGNYDYNADGTIAGTIDSQGRRTEIAAYPLQVRVTDPFGRTTTYNYTLNSELAQIIDATGLSLFVNQYDTQHRVTRTTDWMGASLVFEYNAAHDLTRFVNRAGKATTYQYDAHHNIVRMTDTTGKATTATYDGNDLPLVETDASGRTTGYTRAANGNLISVTGNDHTVVASYTYGTRGELLTATDKDGRRTTLAYDGFLNLVSHTAPDGTRQTATASRLGRPLTHTTPRGEVRSWSYDTANRLSTTTYENGGAVSTTWNADDRRTGVSNRVGGTTVSWTASYGGDGRVDATARNGIPDQTAPADLSIPPAMPPPTCQPSCAGRTCGSNGCGGSCGTCSTGQSCNLGFCSGSGSGSGSGVP